MTLARVIVPTDMFSLTVAGDDTDVRRNIALLTIASDDSVRIRSDPVYGDHRVIIPERDEDITWQQARLLMGLKSPDTGISADIVSWSSYIRLTDAEYAAVIAPIPSASFPDDPPLPEAEYQPTDEGGNPIGDPIRRTWQEWQTRRGHEEIDPATEPGYRFVAGWSGASYAVTGLELRSVERSLGLPAGADERIITAAEFRELQQTNIPPVP